MLRTLATAIALACFALGAAPASAGADIAALTALKADRVVVFKSERRLPTSTTWPPRSASS